MSGDNGDTIGKVTEEQPKAEDQTQDQAKETEEKKTPEQIEEDKLNAKRMDMQKHPENYICLWEKHSRTQRQHHSNYRRNNI